MSYTPGRVIKRFLLENGHSVELVARPDGAFSFHERAFESGSQDGYADYLYSSPVYISAESAEAAARQKFKL